MSKLISKFLDAAIISGLSEDTEADNSDLLLVSNAEGTSLNKMSRLNFLDGGGFGERRFCEMHKVTSDEDTAGYFTLTHIPVNANSVSVYNTEGIYMNYAVYVNKQCVGATGISPSFDVLNGNEIHINNNGDAEGLTVRINTNDEILIEYTYAQAASYVCEFNSQLTTNGTFSGTMTRKTVDSNSIGLGAILYVASDGNLEEADADSIATALGVYMAIDTGTGANKRVLREGYLCNTSWSLTPGEQLFLSETAGEFVNVSNLPADTGDIILAIGIAESTTMIHFKPEMVTVELS